MGKTKKTGNLEGVATENGNYGSPIYLTLNGNNWQVNGYYLLIAMEQAEEYDVPLYVTSNSGAPNLPPPCVPGMPGYPNCTG